MVICNRDISCGGCMDVDNQHGTASNGAPVDANGQLTQPIKREMQQFAKNQRANQWHNNMSDYQTYGTADSNQQFKASLRSSQQNSEGLAGFNSKQIQDYVSSNAHNNTQRQRKLMIQKITEQSQVPALQLKVLSSAYLEKDFSILLNPFGIVPQASPSFQGLENGPRRQEFDGFTYFGVEDGLRGEDDEDDGAGATGGFIEDAAGRQVLRREMNDFLIPKINLNGSADASKDQTSMNPMGGDGNNHQGRQFYIQFDPLDKLYKIRDLGKGYGAFAKLQGSIVIRDSFLINIGESYVVTYLVSTADEEDSNQALPFKLKLKIFPPYNLENPDVVICQNEQQELVIGRSPNCDIRIDDQLISKMQSTIRCEDGQWILEDGRDGKESTNGTWYYLNQEQPISDGMIFKQNQTFFVANFV
jgi:hypothetical protein